MHRLLLLVPLALGPVPLLAGGTDNPVPPPVVSGGLRTAAASPAPALPGVAGPAGTGQRLYVPAAATLVAPPAVDGVLRGFRLVYAAESAPRIAIYVNRRTLDPVAPDTSANGTSGARLGETTSGSTAAGGKETSATGPAFPPTAAGPSLADRQTIREIERLFGRAFRQGGARLTDPDVAAALLPDDGTRLAGATSAPQRRALDPVADIAVEVLISSRSLTVPEVSGDATYTVPDIQATAIRLKDAAIVGQAAASDVIGQGTAAGRIVRRFSVAEIVEATALALMADMAKGK